MKEIRLDKPEQLTAYIDAEFGRLSVAVQEAITATVEEVAKEAVKKLKATSPPLEKSKRDKYRKGWKYKMTKVQADGSFQCTIYNAKLGSITQLLEKGHPLVSKGVVVGQARAFPHIAPVNNWVHTDGIKKIESAVQKAITNLKT